MGGVRRGTSNGNSSGSAETRRRRKRWLLETYRADVDLLITPIGTVFGSASADYVYEGPCTRVPACRCYRCGRLLTFETLTVDRIIPGCQGGTYRRDNIRPACGPCNEKTGGAVRAKPKKRRKPEPSSQVRVIVSGSWECQ